MKIAVNTRLLLHDKLDGIGWFSFETLKRITQQHPEHEFVFIFDRKPSEEFIFSDNVKAEVAFPQARHPVLWYLFFEFGIPAVLRKIKPDLFFSPDGWLSLRTQVKSVNVIHDLNFENHPEFLPPLVRKYYHYFFPRFAAKAQRIATVSEFTREDIHEKYGIDPDNIDVVYNGANENYVPLDKETIQKTRDIYTKGQPYFVFVGTLHPRKNLTNQFRAFDKFRAHSPDDIKFLVVGEKKWWTEDIRSAFEGMKHKDQVFFTGRKSTEELHKIVGSALAMTYASFFEGFGIPIVESFYCGTPVITSNVSSMPEVAGDAALLADPFSVDSIAGAMMKMASDKDLRERLIRAGLERKKMFSWQQSADRLWNCIEKVLIER